VGFADAFGAPARLACCAFITSAKENHMSISTKGRFAVNALIDLALREAAGPVALATICARQQVSLSYLEQLFSRLRREGIVQSTRGPGGGYVLGRPSTQISVADIVTALEEPRPTVDGKAGDNDLSHSVWVRLETTMLQHMTTITLASLVGEQLAQGAAVATKPVRQAIAPAQEAQTPRTTAPNSVFAFGRSFAR
jgi:Rrf2 family iron-sulfur cluster assembly transcriptional regulator